MKKKITILFVLLMLCLCLYADGEPTASAPIPLLLLGHINTSTRFTISFDQNVLPIDLDDEAISQVSRPEQQIYGLKIGSFSLSSTTPLFSLTVLHDKLHLTERIYGTEFDDGNGNTISDPGTADSIDYRLYMETGSIQNNFQSCKSSTNADLSDYSVLNNAAALGEYIRFAGSIIDINDMGIYVILDDSSVNSSDLKVGRYTSTLYFYLEI